MKIRALILAGAASVTLLPLPAAAQSNDNDSTPLNSRIRRNRQFPTDLAPRWVAESSAVSRTRNRAMLNQFSKCIYNRSREGSHELLAKTDLGFGDFKQIDLESDKAARIYGFRDCLSRVASTHETGVALRFNAASLRQMLVQEAYFDRFEDGPTWIKPGYSIGQREFPLSGQITGVRAVLDFADCVVGTDPYSADYFFRTSPGTPEEQAVLSGMTPTLGACIPQGQQVQLSPVLLRTWLGEALWHAVSQSGEVQP